MLNKIIKFSLSNRIAVLSILAVTLIWGCVTMLNKDVDIFPDLNTTTVVVMTECQGMSPEEVEKIVTFPIETTLNGASYVKRVRSSSSTGFSVVWVEFDWDMDAYKARQIVSEKLSTIDLPSNVSAPIMGPQSSILGEIYILGLSSDSISATQLRSLADREIAPRFLALGGISQVSVIGGDVAEYEILLSSEKMRMLNVSLQEVRDAVNNLNSNTSGGVVYDFGNEYLVKTDIHTSSAEDIENCVVRSDINGVIALSDVAVVKQGVKTPKLGAASVNANNAVLLTVTKQPEVSTIQLTKKIDQTISDLKGNLPQGINFTTDIFRQSDFISTSISNLQISLFEGALFVIIILFIFLMNVRTTIISVVALPISIIITVLIMDWLGLSINTMSLGGIAIAIGSLVDDAIVDVENVYKRIRQNNLLDPSNRKDTLTVVYEASKEVRLPILNSTLIIISSFLPLFFLSGLGGKMLIPLGISFIVALASSTIVALTVTPVLCSYLLAGGSRPGNTELKDPWLTKKINAIYKKSLVAAFNHKHSIITATLILLVVSIACTFSLGRGFLPSFNEGSLTINVSTFPGVSLEESNKIGNLAEQIILSVPEIKTVARKTGRAELDEHSLGANVSEIEAPYVLSNRSRAEMVSELREKLAELPGTNIEIGQPISHRIDAMLSGSEAQVAIKLFGSDLETLFNIASDIKEEISEVDGIVDVNVEQQVNRPQIDIRPKREMLKRYGITMDQFATSVSTLMIGEVVSQVYVEGLPYDITLKIDLNEINGINKIGDILIDSNQGKIPLSSVAEIISTSGPNTINRENASRRILISTNVSGRDLIGAVNEIKSVINKIELPEGYYVTYGGQFESEAEATRTLAITSIGAVLLIFLLLYKQFHNAPQSLIILTDMPLALIGGVIILFLTGSEINIPAIIGFISLMGISTRGGMLLISRYNTLIHEGNSLLDTIVKGSTDRLNPIIMTALTSALALIPLALRSHEAGNEIQSPMALVILGGLISSTILNLYVVPILFSYVSKRTAKNK